LPFILTFNFYLCDFNKKTEELLITKLKDDTDIEVWNL